MVLDGRMSLSGGKRRQVPDGLSHSDIFFQIGVCVGHGFDGLVRSASARLKDAHIETLSIESRFDLGYNASHALALAALR